MTNIDEHDAPTTPQAVDALAPGMTGRWLVTTQGSTHIWDLDAGTYTRLPGEHSVAGAFDYDGKAMVITRVNIWPSVGGYSHLFYDDPDFPELLEWFRISSTIKSIEKID